MAKQLEAAGFPGIRGAGGLGMWPDPDGVELQLFQPPAGLVTAAVPSNLDVANDGLVAPLGVDHVLLLVNDVERSLPSYRLVYGAQTEGPRDTNGRVWIRLEAQHPDRTADSRANGESPRIGHYSIKVAAIRSRRRDRAAAADQRQDRAVAG